jgi:hypothetical protein
MKIFSPILKGTTTVAQGTTNLSGSFTGSLFGTAATASYADNFTVGGTLTAQTINVQIITSSIEFNTGSTRNGALSTNTHEFTGSVFMSGSVGVGTSSPNRLFTIKNSSDESNGIGFQNYASTAELAYIRYGQNNDTLDIVNTSNYASGGILLKTNSTERMRITSGGNVGIGTSTPAWMFEINKDTTSGVTGGYPAISVNNPNAAGYSGYYLYKGSTQKAGFEYNNAADQLSIIANSATRMTIESALVSIYGTNNQTRLRLQIKDKYSKPVPTHKKNYQNEPMIIKDLNM